VGKEGIPTSQAVELKGSVLTSLMNWIMLMRATSFITAIGVVSGETA
jgi:hypothetical protein